MNPVRPKADERADLFAEEVRQELHRLLESAAFRGSHRCRSFLEFVVVKALHGDGETLKERTLAVEVYGREVGADLTEDSIVRVGAREVRKRLAQYYLDEGAGDSIRIGLPAGAYVPVFHPASVEAEPPPVEPAPSEPQPAIRRRSWWLGAVAVFIAIGILAAAWRWFPRPLNEFEVFWRPGFNQNTSVVLALAHPIVYHPSTRALVLTDKKNGPGNLAFQRPVDYSPELLNGSDFVPVFDQYVGFGDTVAALRLAGLFAERSRAVRVRLSSKLDFNDLRDSATILVGAFTNRWTAELMQSFRYRFAFTELRQPCLVDSSTGKRWILDKADNGSSKEDYILICRVVHSQTGRFIVVGAGLTQYGTQEAGRILAEPDSLMPLLKQLPANWRHQNLELVLHSQVVGDAPTPPELVGWHVW